MPFFEIVQEILSYYTCPATCPAICCKIADINMDKKDQEILKQASKYDAEKIVPCHEDGEYHCKISPPCPFLESDRCGVYGRRPAICRMFPFNICNMPDVLLLFPCEMAASIFKDYIEYSDNILKHPLPAKTVAEFEQSHCSFKRKLDDGLPIPMLLIKIDSLLPFKEYLKLRSV